jgi:Txe/YoeB family toxin of Txe-Axe toxin-antitoxin module
LTLFCTRCIKTHQCQGVIQMKWICDAIVGARRCKHSVKGRITEYEQLLVRIPEQYARDMNISHRDIVEVYEDRDDLIIRKRKDV